MCMSYSDWLDSEIGLKTKERTEQAYDDMNYSTFGHLKKDFKKEDFVSELLEAKYNEYFQNKMVSSKDLKYKD